MDFDVSRRSRRAPVTRGTRLRRGLTWPHPGGIGAAVLGAALIFCGALSLGTPSASVGRASFTTTTPSSRALPAHSPSATLIPRPAAAPSSVPSTAKAHATTKEPSSPLATPLIAGARADAPIQRLFATGTATLAQQALHSIANPASPLVLVNKTHPLVPVDYVPSDLATPAVHSGSAEPVRLRAEAAAAVERMFAAASAAGVSISVKSSYRSFATQHSVYNGYVAAKGVSAADSSSARPGFSEHQSGFALDIGDANAGAECDFTACVATTAAGLWVAAHGADYGFVVRYPMGMESTTGYLGEPWHLRYVGIAVAQDIRVRGIQSYEEYLGLPAAPGYE